DQLQFRRRRVDRARQRPPAELTGPLMDAPGRPRPGALLSCLTHQRCGPCTSWPRKVSSTHFSTRLKRWSMFFIFLSPSYFIQHCVLASSGVSATFGGGSAGAAGCPAGWAAGVRSAVLLPCAQAASSAAVQNTARTSLGGGWRPVRGDLRIATVIA